MTTAIETEPAPKVEQVDWVDWMATRLFIKGEKPGQLLPFVLNDAQNHIAELMREQRAAGYPVRIIIYKSRKHGVSTFTGGLFYTLVQNLPNRNAFVCAHTAESSNDLFKIIQLFNENLPADEVKEQKYSSAREIVWAGPHNSQYQVRTAGNKKLGRGPTIHYLHISELAYWEDDSQALLSVMQAVPDDPDTIVVIESTANGDAGSFRDMYWEAKAFRKKHPGLLEGYTPVFLSWLDHPKYSMPVPAKYKGGNLTEREKFLTGKLKATREQLYWRRWCIRNKCGDDEDNFKQEYPATEQDGFLASGRPAFAARIIQAHRNTARAPRYATLEWEDHEHRIVRPVYGDYAEGTAGVWRIWTEPQELWDYVIGGDPATDEPSDPNKEKSDLDNAAIMVLCRSELKTAALYVGRPTAHGFANEMLKAHRWYNNAWLTPEVNNTGIAVLEKLIEADCDKIMPRYGPIEDHELKEPHKLGWRTDTRGNRDSLIWEWIKACDPGKYERHKQTITCLSGELAEEEATFIIDKRGKRIHKAGCHDDVLFAAMIAYHVHQKMPRERRVLQPEHGAYIRRRSDMVGFEGGRDLDLVDIERDDASMYDRLVEIAV